MHSYPNIFSFRLCSVYNNGKYSDLIIKCGERTFNVHRIIVCTQSKVLAAMINHNFKVGYPKIFLMYRSLIFLIKYIIEKGYVFYNPYYCLFGLKKRYNFYDLINYSIIIYN